jgi:N-glycosidase YbiA
VKAILFYRVNEPYGCFSNFSRHQIVIEGETWPTTEHYFQAMKFAGDPERRERIRLADNAREAKALAWAPDAAVRSDWNSVRDEVMLVALRAKFTQHEDLKSTLLGTGTKELVEHTTNDRYWADGGDGTGKNVLGKLLIRVREELRESVS